MTIELNDESYILGMWFSFDPLTENSWLGCVIKDPTNPKRFKGWSRFRYKKDKKIFDSDDSKNWHTFTSDENTHEDFIIKTMEAIQNRISIKYPEKDFIRVNGDLKKLISLSKDKDWLHFKSNPLH